VALASVANTILYERAMSTYIPKHINDFLKRIFLLVNMLLLISYKGSTINNQSGKLWSP